VLVQRQLMTSRRLCRNNHSGPNKVQQHQICPRRRYRSGAETSSSPPSTTPKSATEAHGKCSSTAAKCSTTVCSSTVAAAQQQRQQKCSTTVCSSTAAAKCSTTVCSSTAAAKCNAAWFEMQTKVCNNHTSQRSVQVDRSKGGQSPLRRSEQGGEHKCLRSSSCQGGDKGFSGNSRNVNNNNNDVCNGTQIEEEQELSTRWTGTSKQRRTTSGTRRSTARWQSSKGGGSGPLTKRQSKLKSRKWKRKRKQGTTISRLRTVRTLKV